MGAVEDILAGIDPTQLARALGTDPDTAMAAASAAIPTLITSLQANAGTDRGAKDLAGALGQHLAADDSGRIDLDEVDTADGRKILKHALADDPQRLQNVGGFGGDLLSKLLPILAPIVMSYIAQKLIGGDQGEGSSQPQDLVGSLLGGVLSSGALGDLVGQLLGGGSPAPAAGRSQRSTTSGTTKSVTRQTQSGSGTSSTNILADILGQVLGR